jgi:hypothetical protein
MKALAMFGVLLYVAGVAAFMYQGIAFATRKKIVGIGRFHLSVKKARRLPMGAIVGSAALVCGTMILALGLINR